MYDDHKLIQIKFNLNGVNFQFVNFKITYLLALNKGLMKYMQGFALYKFFKMWYFHILTKILSKQDAYL